MYINPFVAGVLATILTEIVIIICVGINVAIKNKGGKR